jgi:polysaccharide export outer membrane protein
VIDNTLTLKQFRSIQFIFICVGSLLLSSCGTYKQNLMFRVPEGTQLQQQVTSIEKNYSVRKNDALHLEVYTNNGERIVDPGSELTRDGVSSKGAEQPKNYLVNVNGVTKLPLVGEIKIEGLTLRQAEEILQKEFARFYQDPYVVLTVSSRRVFVLGAPGGQVIPLVNENTTLVEILAAAKGVEKNGKAHNIRVLRGDQIFVADFSTFEGFKKGNMILEPGDVVYVEPVRRPFSEGLQEYGPAISVLVSLVTLIVVVTQATN